MLDAATFTCARCERSLPEKQHGASVVTQHDAPVWHLCVSCLLILSLTPMAQAERARLWDGWLKTGRVGND